MNLNPVIKFDIDCRVPAEKAKERLVEITKKLSFFTPDFGQFNATDKRRYIGRIGEKRFSLRTRPRKSLAGFFLHTNRQIVVSGELEPRGQGFHRADDGLKIDGAADLSAKARGGVAHDFSSSAASGSGSILDRVLFQCLGEIS